MILQSGGLVVAPIGAVVYMVAFALYVKQVGTDALSQNIEVLILILLSVIGVLLRLGYKELKDQVAKANAIAVDAKERSIRLEATLDAIARPRHIPIADG